MTITRRRIVYALTGVAAAAAGVGWSLWRQPAEAPVDSGLWSMTFERPQGGLLAMSSFRGRVVVLNFWATWCPPCIEELPDLDRFHASHVARGIEVVGLAVDGPTPVREFLARKPLSFSVGLAGFEGSDLSRRLGNTSGALPFTALFDRQGRPRQHKLGRTRLDELERWIEGL